MLISSAPSLGLLVSIDHVWAPRGAFQPGSRMVNDGRVTLVGLWDAPWSPLASPWIHSDLPSHPLKVRRAPSRGLGPSSRDLAPLKVSQQPLGEPKLFIL